METTKVWIKTLIATFIQGGATVTAVIIVDPVAFNLGEQWQKTLTVFVVAGVVGMLGYLKKSPLPGVDGTKLGIALLCASLSLGLTGAMCKETSSYKRAAQACYDLSVGINATVQVTKALNEQGVINNQDYLSLLQLEKSLVLSNEEFRKLLSQAGQINSANKSAFIAIVDNLAVSLGTLQEQGVLRIKSTNSQLTFSAALTTIRVSLAALRAFLSNVTSPVAIPPTFKAQASNMTFNPTYLQLAQGEIQ